MENTVKQVNILSKEFYDKVEKLDSSRNFTERFNEIKEQVTQTVAPSTLPGNQGGADTNESGTSSVEETVENQTEYASGESSDQTPVQYQENHNDETAE